jgi:hypothetical protein
MTNDGWMGGWMEVMVRMGHNYRYTMHGRQLTYPLRRDAQHKQLPQQLRVFRIHSSGLHRSLGRKEMQTNQWTTLRLDECYTASF